jgi:hypothetical protein
MRQATLHRRITFGWEALREKLLLSGSGLNDVTAELCKFSLIQRGRCSQPDETAELRFCDIRTEECTIATFFPSSDEPANPQRVPRDLFDEVGRNVDEWRAAQAELSTGTFVDLKRLESEAA